MRGVEALLGTDERIMWHLDDLDEEDMSAVVTVVVKVCCKYFAVIRQYKSFKILRLQFPKPILYITYYAAAKGDMLGHDLRLGTHAAIVNRLEDDDE